MISADLGEKIRRIQIITRKNATAVFAGEYTSAYKGQGIEFEEVRAYQPGDEVRWIDWNVTARTGIPHIKRFREERELTVFILVDMSASGMFGSAGREKRETAAEAAALLALTANMNNDRSGLILFTDKVEQCIHPGKGTRHVTRIISEILSYKAEGKGTSLNKAFDYLGKIQHRRAVVFVISDFIDSGYETKLAALARFHDITALSVVDPGENKLPENSGILKLADPESGRFIWADTGNRKVREYWERRSKERRYTLKEIMKRNNIDWLELNSHTDWVHDLSLFFMRRQTRA